MGQPEQVLRVLGLFESDSDLSRITRYLAYLGPRIHAELATSLAQMKTLLENSQWNVVLSMSNVESLPSREALCEVKKICPELPFILISNGMGEEEVVDLMKAGAEDVVLISRTHRLLQAVRRIMKDSEVKEKEDNARRIEHEAYAAREQMLAVVSHDIKNPLSAIQLEAQMLLRVAERYGRTLMSEEVKIQGKRILKITDRLKSLISDLLDKNKSAEGLTHLNKESTDLCRTFQEIVDSSRSLIRQKDIKVRTNFRGNAELLVDKNKIIQVISNLLGNAIKFSPVGGEIMLSMEERGSEILISVQDNGEGLGPEYIGKVFEKYWTAEIKGRSGTGLGLFICKTIVEAHGGLIRAENVSCGGAKFSFSIPRPVPDVELWTRDHEKKILVIDDDNDLREVICWALGKEGLSVHGYGDAASALENIRKGRHRPELMLVDFHMDGMKGSEFLKHKIQCEAQEVRDCPVLMISASPEEVERELEPGLCQQVISKPIDLEGLVEKVRALVTTT